MAEPYLSIVIPAYNESLRIGKTLDAVRNYAASRPFETEIVLVDDGSTDGTPELLKEFQSLWPQTRVLVNEINRGKGYSVRRGVLESRGELILFTDADLSAPIEEADKLLAALDATGADAAIGSRALDRKLIGVHQPWRREFAGRCFNLLVRIFTGLALHDTQCGLKLFRRGSTRRAFELQRVERFGFDPEVLFLIERFGGKIVEVPVRWNDNPATKVHFLRDSTRMLLDLIALRWRALTGKSSV
ncbi:MAG TPA: dolichyl-phosphate beta-glucosyltransferase [Terriglobia bacterium]|jgi:glycosyltransferase involved in cell wall biosynthesis|nr:dolichyl-phosphate beta-glucosyltransferase [Terriglobia bacterium]